MSQLRNRIKVGFKILAPIFIWMAAYRIAILLWPHIFLPFRNPAGIVGPLTLQGFNPVNNIVRYLVFLFIPTTAVSLYCIKTRFSNRSEVFRELNIRRWPWIENVSEERNIWYNWPVYVLVSATLFFLICFRNIVQSSFHQYLNIFHDGEFLAPAINTLQTGKLWTATFFAHGFGNDPGLTLLAWKYFGVSTVGAMRVLRYWADEAVYFPIGILIVSYAYYLKKMQTRNFIIISLVVISMILSCFGPRFLLVVRDIPVLLTMSMLILTFTIESSFFGALTGIIAGLSPFFAIDRGGYNILTALVTILLALLIDFRRTAKISLAIVAGILAGITAVGALVGWSELKDGFSTSFYFYRWKDYFDAMIVPHPSLSFHSIENGNINLIAIGFLSFILVRIFGLQRSKLSTIVEGSLLVMMVLTFRSALGRFDGGHVMYASFWVYFFIAIQLGIFIELILKHTGLAQQKINFVGFLMIVGCCIYQYNSISWQKFATFHETVNTFVQRPDESFLHPNQIEDQAIFKVLPALQKLAKREKCFYSTTNEAILLYLLNKRSCSKYIIPWFISAPARQKEAIEELATEDPGFILYHSDYWTNSMDGIPFEVRTPLLNEWIRSHYQLETNIGNGYVVRSKGPLEM